MKIAIVTLYGNFNYGNRLQNYALQATLCGYGHSVKTIGASANTNGIKNFLKKYLVKKNGNYTFKKMQEIKREKAFDRFTKRNIPTCMFHTQDGKIPKTVDSEYDVFIVGSDQVWNPMFWRDSDESCDLFNFFLGFTNRVKIAYAASFGIEKIPEKWEKRIQPLISRFDYISVREKAGCTITDMLGVQSELVLDPTLLLDAPTWRKMERNTVVEKSYILVYFLGEKADYIKEEIHSVAVYRHLTIINLCDERSKFYQCGPETFLELIDKAEIVYTDSFHASVFSILFHTEFAVFNRSHVNRSDMSSRIRTLLDTVGIDDGMSDMKIVYNQDFRKYDELLKIEREKSLSFLVKALKC